MAVYIDLSNSGGSGTLVNPYGLADGVAALKALSGSQSGESFLFKSGTLGRIPSEITLAATVSNFTLGTYGTGDRPIICGSKIVTGWSAASGIYSIPWEADVLPAIVARDAFFYGDTEGTFGAKLVFAPTLADCQATTYSQFYDATAKLMYVNLDGLNPNNYVMEATHDAAPMNLRLLAGDHSNTVIDGLKCVNARDSGFFINYNAGNGLTVTDYWAEQNGALLDVGDWVDRGGMQIVGSGTHGQYMEECVIERYTNINSLHAGLTLLYLKDPVLYDIYMNGVGGVNLGLWTDIVGADISNVEIYNVIPQKFWNAAEFGAGQTTQKDHIAFYAPNTGVGADGYSYNNRLSGFVFANCFESAIRIFEGAGWVIENGTIYQSAISSVSNQGNALKFNKGGSNPVDYLEVTLNNNIIIYDLSVTKAFIEYDDPMVDAHVHGDDNIYVGFGAGTPRWWTPGESSNFAAYQTAVATSGLDQVNSTYTTTLPIRSVGNISVDNHPLGPNYALAGYMTGHDFTPLNLVDGDASDSVVLNAGSQAYSTVNTPPTLGALSTAVSGALAGRTYFVAASYVGDHGETLITAEGSQAVAANSVLTVAAPVAPPSWAIGWNVYFSESSGALKMQNALPIATDTAFTEPDTGALTGVTAKNPLATAINPNVTADATGEPFATTPDQGGIQHRISTHPARFSRASGGWS